MAVRRNRRFFDGHASDGIDESREYWKLLELVVEILVVAAVGVRLLSRTTARAHGTRSDGAVERLVVVRFLHLLLRLLRLLWGLRFLLLDDLLNHDHARFTLDGFGAREALVLEVESQVTRHRVHHIVFVLDDIVFDQGSVIIRALVTDAAWDTFGKRAPFVVRLAARKRGDDIHELLVFFVRPFPVRLHLSRFVESIIVLIFILFAILPRLDTRLGPSFVRVDLRLRELFRHLRARDGVV